MEETKSFQEGDGDRLSTKVKIAIGAGVLLGAVLLILALIFLLRNPSTTETVRDLFIIVLALESILIVALLAILIYQLIVLIRMLRDDIKPLIESTHETVNTAKGTATFVSEQVTKPAIAGLSYATGIGQSINVLLRMLPRRRSLPTAGEEAATDLAN